MSADLIFADTNVFLRYLTNDIPEQAAAFEGLIRKAGAGDVALITTAMVLAEIVWTLESYYHLEKSAIQDRILAILNTPGLTVDEGELILNAILWYREKNVDFIDAYHAAWMSRRGINKICTLDRKHFSRFAEIEIVSPGGGSEK